MCCNFSKDLESSFIRKLSFGFVVSSLLIAAIAFLCEYFNYFGWFATFTGRIFFLGVFSVLFGLLFGYSFGLYITRNIKNLMNATSVISKGDLRHKIEVMSDDELGILTRTFNSMVDSLVEMVKEVRTVSDTIHDSALDLSSTSEQMNATTQDISVTVESIAGGTKWQTDMGDYQLPESFPVFVTEHHNRRIAWVVDELIAEKDILMKPLGEPLSHLGCYNGASVLGKGDVVPLLDLENLYRELFV